ncbi:hypothetical protein PRZ48_003617 [Zasmidium cellare]|uniref:Uncharacterized protein n=1 Tax=Zasmidium cellare TaxID=395010 RepID=A0ABR0EVK1_ZASCE|nr:hypothetical protein PRZ48_003617 [Zasmidium cellare]
MAFPTLAQRAEAWKEGDLSTLEELTDDITLAFNKLNDSNKDDVRNAVEELLIHEHLPTFHRAQLLVYKAGTEQPNDYPRIRERLEDAKFWITDLKASKRDRGGVEEKVITLEGKIDAKLAELDGVDGGGKEFAEKMKRMEELRSFERASKLVGRAGGQDVLEGELREREKKASQRVEEEREASP